MNDNKLLYQHQVISIELLNKMKLLADTLTDVMQLVTALVKEVEDA